jgi:hypothetical protein
MKKLIIAAALCTGLLGAQAAPLFEAPQQPVTQQAPAKKPAAKAAADKKTYAKVHHRTTKARKATHAAKAKSMEKRTATAPASEAKPVTRQSEKK